MMASGVSTRPTRLNKRYDGTARAVLGTMIAPSSRLNTSRLPGKSNLAKPYPAAVASAAAPPARGLNPRPLAGKANWGEPVPARGARPPPPACADHGVQRGVGEPAEVDTVLIAGHLPDVAGQVESTAGEPQPEAVEQLADIL